MKRDELTIETISPALELKIAGGKGVETPTKKAQQTEGETTPPEVNSMPHSGHGANLAVVSALLSCFSSSALTASLCNTYKIGASSSCMPYKTQPQHNARVSLRHRER